MVSLSDVRAAAELLRGVAVETPVLRSEYFSRVCGAEVYFKCENLQRTGSFKVRGAACKLRRCRERIGPAGAVAASAGNHAQGVALAAADLGVPATIVMPEGASPAKQLATQAYGGRVLLHGTSVADCLERAQALEAEGYFFVHPFDDDDVIAGQGTVGLELTTQVGRVDEVWVPVGGGGLLAGLAVAVKETFPSVRLVGVQAEACPSALAARAAGHPVRVEPCATVADGIAVARIGDRPSEILARYVDDLVAVGEDAIAAAMVHLLERKKVLAEGAGAAPLAALLAAGPERVRGRRVAVIVSGGNVDLSLLDRVVERGLLHAGRVRTFSVVLSDVPGALASLLEVLTREKANILHLHHDRLAAGVPLGSTRVALWLETRGSAHGRQIAEALEEAGFAVPEAAA